ncbi:hypothetical protein JTB14_025403 [Gonioctena quinquepunctata]|nr:hypothetical protein JTB14_025403 [Gonioctena quinquepunctata]
MKLVKEEDAQETVYYLSKDGILYRVENDGDELMVPKTCIPKVMEDFHDSPMAGHPGQQKTSASLKPSTAEEHQSMREQGKKKREHKKQHTELESEEEAEEIPPNDGSAIRKCGTRGKYHSPE